MRILTPSDTVVQIIRKKKVNDLRGVSMYPIRAYQSCNDLDYRIDVKIQIFTASSTAHPEGSASQRVSLRSSPASTCRGSRPAGILLGNGYHSPPCSTASLPLRKRGAGQQPRSVEHEADSKRYRRHTVHRGRTSTASAFGYSTLKARLSSPARAGSETCLVRY